MYQLNCKQPGVIAIPNSAANQPFYYCTLKRKALPLSVYKNVFGFGSNELCREHALLFFPNIRFVIYSIRTIISHHYTHFTPSLWYIERNGDLSEASCPADVRLHSWTTPPPHPPLFTETRFNSRDQRDPVMDEETIKTPNPKCRLYWCFIELIDWIYSQSCWYFRPALWRTAPFTFSLVVTVYTCMQCVRGEGGVWGHKRGGGLRQIFTCRQVPLLVNF